MDEPRLRKRNYIFIMLEGILFLSGISFMDTSAIIPIFIYSYTQSFELAGLATTLSLAASVVTQTLLGPYVNGIPNMPAHIKRVIFLFRPLPLLMVPILLGNLEPKLTVILFLIIFTLFWCSDGLTIVPWGDLFARTIVPEKRGKLIGFMQLFGGIGSLAAGYLIKYTLENPGFSDAVRFSILFGSAGVLLILASTAFSFTRDLPRTPSAAKANPFHYYRKLPGYFRRNGDFARMAYVRVFYSVTTMISPFLILFGQNLYGLDASQVSTLIYLQIVGSLLGGIVWGTISSRAGNKSVIVLSQIVSLLLPALALGCLLIKTLSVPFFVLLFIVLVNGMLRGSWLGYMNYTMDITGEEDRTIYLLLNSLITFPLTFLSFIAGALADRWGFVPLFGISAVAAVIGIYLALRLKSLNQIRERQSLTM